MAGIHELTRVDRWLDELLAGDLELGAAVDQARLEVGATVDQVAAAAGERVFGEYATPDALEPFVVFATVGGPTGAGADLGARTDSSVIGARVLTTVPYVVKAVGPGGSYRPLEPIADRIDALLQDAGDFLEVAALAAGGAGVIIAGSERVAPVKYPEVADSRQFRHLGGLYRLTVHPAP